MSSQETAPRDTSPGAELRRLAQEFAVTYLDGDTSVDAHPAESFNGAHWGQVAWLKTTIKGRPGVHVMKHWFLATRMNYERSAWTKFVRELIYPWRWRSQPYFWVRSDGKLVVTYSWHSKARYDKVTQVPTFEVDYDKFDGDDFYHLQRSFHDKYHYDDYRNF